MSDYQEKALRLVAEQHGMVTSELYIVWFCKTLQNWKALISTDIMSGHYWEVTYSGDSETAYIDWYKKHKNTSVPDLFSVRL